MTSELDFFDEPTCHVANIKSNQSTIQEAIANTIILTSHPHFFHSLFPTHIKKVPPAVLRTNILTFFTLTKVETSQNGRASRRQAAFTGLLSARRLQ